MPGGVAGGLGERVIARMVVKDAVGGGDGVARDTDGLGDVDANDVTLTTATTPEVPGDPGPDAPGEVPAPEDTREEDAHEEPPPPPLLEPPLPPP